MGGREEEVATRDVARLAFQMIFQRLVFALEECHVGCPLPVLEILYQGLGHGAAFCAQGEFQFLVLQHDIAGSAIQGSIEECGAVFACLCQCCLLLGCLCLFLFLCLALLGLCFFHLFLLCFQFLFCRTVVPTEADEHGGYQHKADNSILIHLFSFEFEVGDVIIIKVQNYTFFTTCTKSIL